MEFYSKNKKELFASLKSSDKGLTSSEAEKRLQKHGSNELKKEQGASPWKILVSQFNSFIVYILIGAFVVSLLLGEVLDASVIGAIIILNALLGFVQEYKAEKSIEALQKLATPTSVVLRNGQKKEINSQELVPGDVVFLEAGNTVPADCYLLEAIALQVDESHLTGESVPVNKKTTVQKSGLSLNDQVNMLFSSTTVTTGRALAIVTTTGMHSEIGKIAGIMQASEKEQTPLQKKLQKLGIKLGVLVLILCVFIFLAGYLVGQPWLEMLLVAISLAVAAIPEGLPAVVTISLAVGVQIMIRKNVLIRKLSAVETLGSTTVICTDKTGTLTRNEMTVQSIYANNHVIKVTGKGYDEKGNFKVDGKSFDTKTVSKLIEAGVVCNDASKVDKFYMGDPTEIALLVLGKKADIYPDYSRVREIPFTSETKYMATWNQVGDDNTIFMKGAPEIVLGKCNRILINNKVRDLNQKDRDDIYGINEDFASGALRVLGFAYSPSGEEKDLIFLGLMGMIDPPRADVKESIAQCKDAGIRVVMITGDHVLTAQAIGERIGITGEAITGVALDKLSQKEFNKKVNDVNIYARVSPEHKVKILEAHKDKGQIVAMTGDGVNDAPAIKRADIGIAVNSSSDVTKQAADMILTDNHFKSIVSAIAEGRHIFNNIRKFVKFLLSCNLSELLTVFISVIIGLGSPLLAVQILWMNLVTDGLPALALSAEPMYKRVMKSPPRDPREPIMNRITLVEMFLVGFVMTTITIFLYTRYLDNPVYAGTVAFTTLVFLQLFYSFSVRSRLSIFKRSLFDNWKLLAAVGISATLQLLVLYTPLNVFMKTEPLLMKDLLIVVGSAFLVVVVVELFKLSCVGLRKVLTN
jgi:P-type Ca2+ transporter type 2C